MLAKCLLKLMKCEVRMILYKVLTPFWDVVSYKKTKHVDDIHLHSLTIGSNYFLENFNVNIMISILHICGILQLSIWQFIGWFGLSWNWLIPWWQKYPWIRCLPSIKSNRWIKWWSSKWVSIKWSSSWQSSIRRTSRWFSTRMWIWIRPYEF